MNYKCTNTGYFKDDGTHSRFFMSDTTDTMQKRNGACTTKYDLTSGKGHKCHGDSELEMRAISTDSAPSSTHARATIGRFARPRLAASTDRKRARTKFGGVWRLRRLLQTQQAIREAGHLQATLQDATT